MRLAPWLLLSIATLGCGGAAHETAAPLGVQSNVPRTSELLRLRPPGPMAFATTLRVHLDSEMMGEPMSADFDTRGLRRVLGVLPDGSLSIEELETQTRYTITMMGSSRTGPDAPSAPVARQYVLGDRGRRLEVPRGAQAAPGAEMQDRLELALDPLVRALEFPEGAVAPGEQWETSGRIPLGDVDPELAGEAAYHVAQRLERFEGSGVNRVAVISFVGSLEGAGTSTAPPGPMPGQPGGPMPGQPMPGQPMPGPMPGQLMPGQPMPGPMPGQPMPGQPMPRQPMPGQPMPGSPMPGGPMDMARIAGEVRFRGFYVVAVADGFARTAEADFEGEVLLGEGLLTFPIRGELEWTAAPVAAGMPVDEPIFGQP